MKLESATVALLDDFSATKTDTNIYSILRELESLPKGTRITRTIDGKEESFVIGEAPRYALSKITDLAKQKYRYNELYKLDYLKIEPPNAAPRIFEKEYVSDESGGSTLRFFDISPVKGVDLKYTVTGTKGPTTVHVRFPKPNDPAEEKRLTSMATQLLENLPAAQADAQGLVLLDSGEYYLKEAAGLASDHVVDGAPVRTTVMLNHVVNSKSTLASRLKTFWHETGHQIAQKLWNNHHFPSAEWARAAAMDGKFLSGYAMQQFEGTLAHVPPAQLIEDIAETVAAYIATDGGRRQPGLRKNFPQRFAILDRVLANPGIAPEVSRMIAAGAASRNLGFLPITLASGAAALYVYDTQPAATQTQN